MKNYISDDNTPLQYMVFSLVSQSNASVVQVDVTSSGLVAAVVGSGRMGKSDVVVRAGDLSGNVADTTIQFVVAGPTGVPETRWKNLR
ncbi:hypothetical protein HS125_18505 [bacterium]|nr:hypothetical protein [bacterium]